MTGEPGDPNGKGTSEGTEPTTTAPPAPATAANGDVERATIKLLRQRPEYRTILATLVKVQLEKAPTWQYEISGIEWRDVPGCAPMQLAQLQQLGILTNVYRSRKYNTYRLTDLVTVKRVLDEMEGFEADAQSQAESLSVDDLFSPIVGYEDVKALFRLSLQAERPVHLLLIGPPSSAKSLFLTEAARLPGAVYAVGSSTSKAGLVDYLFEHEPRYLIIDELEKADSKDFAALLTPMEEGTVSEMKYGRTRSTSLRFTVYAAANTEAPIPVPLLSRFERLHFRPYTEAEFMETVRRVLETREHVTDAGLAEYIAYVVWRDLRSRDPREAVRISRLCKTKEAVETTVRVLQKYRPNGGAY